MSTVQPYETPYQEWRRLTREVEAMPEGPAKEEVRKRIAELYKQAFPDRN